MLKAFSLDVPGRPSIQNHKILIFSTQQIEILKNKTYKYREVCSIKMRFKTIKIIMKQYPYNQLLDHITVLNQVHWKEMRLNILTFIMKQQFSWVRFLQYFFLFQFFSTCRELAEVALFFLRCLFKKTNNTN